MIEILENRSDPQLNQFAKHVKQPHIMRTLMVIIIIMSMMRMKMRMRMRRCRETSRATTMSSKPMLPPASSVSRHMKPRGPTFVTEMITMTMMTENIQVDVITSITILMMIIIIVIIIVHPVVDHNQHHIDQNHHNEKKFSL